MVQYPGELKPLPTEGLYWQITAFFKSALCENVRLLVSTILVSLLVIFDFAGIAHGYMVLDVHPAFAFFLLVRIFTLPNPTICKSTAISDLHFRHVSSHSFLL